MGVYEKVNAIIDERFAAAGIGTKGKSEPAADDVGTVQRQVALEDDSALARAAANADSGTATTAADPVPEPEADDKASASKRTAGRSRNT